MAAFIFGEKIDFNIVPNPEPGGFVVGYDLDGILKQKDEFGVITKIGGGSGNLMSVLAQGNHSGTYSIVLDNGSYISNNAGNKINLNNSAISLTTDNELYGQSYLYLTATDAILANAASSFRIEGNAIKLIYDANNNQIITNNSYKLRVNNSNVLEFSYGGLTASPGSRANAIISSDGSIINPSLINTVIIGGVNITATQSNSVYVPGLYVQDSRYIRGTNGTIFMSGNNINSVIGIQSSSSTMLTNNGIILKDTATQSTSPNLDSGITYISSKNSRNNAGVKNTVVVGGTNINATASDTVYLGNKVNVSNLYYLPLTDGSAGQIMRTDGLGNLSWTTQEIGSAISLNYVQFRADYENKVLAKNSTYVIIDADKSLYDNVNGTEVYLSTDGYGNVKDGSYGKFWNPRYDKSVQRYGIFNSASTYNVNDITIWGGYCWVRLNSAGAGTPIDLFNLDSNWLKIPFGNTYYNLSYDPITYDISNNRIIARSDSFNNYVSTSYENITYWINTMSLNNPIKAFQWGNGFDGESGISGNILIDSYNENINFIGLFQTDINFVNKSYQSNIEFGPSASQTNFLFSNSSYQSNITFGGSSSQSNLTFNNNSFQENLEENTGLAQNGLNLNNYNSDRDLDPMSGNESYTGIGNDLIVNGNLKVTGTTSTINSVNLTIKDPLILLAGSQSGMPTLDSGIIIDRGSLDNAAFIWNESNDEFAFISTDDDSSTSGSVNIIDYQNIRAKSFIVNGGTSSQFLKADGTLDSTVYAIDNTVVHIYGTESIIGLKTYTPPVNRTGFIVDMPMVDNSPTGGVPDSVRIYTRGHNGSSTSNVSGVYHVAYGNKNSGFAMINLPTDPDLTNSIGVDISFKSNSTTNTIIRGRKDQTVTFIVTDAGDLTANKITKIGGTSSQFLKADGSVDSNVYLTVESDTLQTVTGRGATTTAVITTNGFIKTGGSATQFLKADGSVDSNVYLTTESDTLQTVTGRGAVTTLSITANSFIKTGGSATQFLKADGSVDSNTYLTSYTETDTLQTVTTRGSVTTTSITANSFIKTGGSATQFLKADGSVDSNTYLTSYTETDTLQTVTTRGATTTLSITANSFIKTGGLATQFLKANGSIDSNTYLTAETDTLQTVTTRGAVTTTSITANSFIKAGGLGTQYLMADGSVTNTFSETDTLETVTARGATTSHSITMTPPVNTNGFVIDMPAVISAPPAGVPDAYTARVRGHNGTSSNIVCAFYAVMEGNKSGGLSVENTDAYPDSTNSIGVDIRFKDTTTTNTIIRGRKGFTNVFNVTDNGDLTATTIAKIGGTAFQHLMADGSTMEISPQVTVSASTVYLDDTYHGKIVKVKGLSTIFVPGTLRTGFNCVFRVFTGANAMFLGTQSGVIEASGQNLTAGKMATLFKDTDTSFNYVIGGDLT